MAEFPHLPLIQTVTGTYKPNRGGGNTAINERTRTNLANRVEYGRSLLNATNTIKDNRERILAERQEVGLPNIPDENAIPVFLQIDTNLFELNIDK